MGIEEKMKRRDLLSGIGLVGASALAGGAATNSLFGDSESVQTTFTAGNLELRTDTVVSVNGEKQVIGNTAGDNQIGFPFNNLKPCDSGTVDITIGRNSDPAYVFGVLDIIADDDNYLTSAEMDDEYTFDPPRPSSSADYNCIFVGRLEGWDSSRRTFDVIENGTRETVRSFMFYIRGADPVQVSLTPHSVENGDLRSFKLNCLKDNYNICAVDIEAGESVKTSFIENESGGTTRILRTPSRGDSIDSIEIYLKRDGGGYFYPETDNDGELDDNMRARFFEINGNTIDLPRRNIRELISQYGLSKADGGFSLGLIDDTKTLRLEWELNCLEGKEIQSDSFELGLDFHAVQARNNDNPVNPWK